MGFSTAKIFGFTMIIFLFFGVGKWVLGQIAPKTPVITATEIRAFQNDLRGETGFVIVDVRSKAETDVSMIPGALTKSEFEKTANQHQGKLVIAYCTIGVRSGNYADSLIRKGWKAWNYKGSILDWCANKLPLINNGQETNKVHTYSERFSAPESYVGVH